MSATFTPTSKLRPTATGRLQRIHPRSRPRRTPSRRLHPRLSSEWDRACCEQQPAPAPRPRPEPAWRAGWPDFRRTALRDRAGPVIAPSALPAAERGQVAARLTALCGECGLAPNADYGLLLIIIAALPYVLGQRTDAVIIGLILAASAGPEFAAVGRRAPDDQKSVLVVPVEPCWWPGGGVFLADPQEHDFEPVGVVHCDAVHFHVAMPLVRHLLPGQEFLGAV